MHFAFFVKYTSLQWSSKGGVHYIILSGGSFNEKIDYYYTIYPVDVNEFLANVSEISVIYVLPKFDRLQ